MPGPIFIERPNGDARSWAFLYIPLFDGDPGDPQYREGRPELANRTPAGVRWDGNSITLTVANGGDIASDLIRVDFEFRLCSLAAHGPADGFTVNHAGEQHGSTRNDVTQIGYVPPRSSVQIDLVVPYLDRDTFPPAWLTNIYFRARVCSIMTAPSPTDLWSYADDPAVTEATLRLAL